MPVTVVTDEERTIRWELGGQNLPRRAQADSGGASDLQRSGTKVQNAPDEVGAAEAAQPDQDLE